MNFKQIIKEEIDNMDWIENVRSNPVATGTLVFIGNTTNTKNSELKTLNPNSYNILRLIVDEDDGKQVVNYDTVVSNNWNHAHINDSITVEWTNRLFSTGYWRLVSENVPQEMLVPTSNLKENNTNIPADDWEPYIMDVSFLFNRFYELNESDIKWIEDEMSSSKGEAWDRNKAYVLDVSELPNRPPRFSHDPKLFKSDIISYAKEMGYDTLGVSSLYNEVCYIYFELESIQAGESVKYYHDLSWDLCDIPDPTYDGKYEIVDMDTFLFLMENKLFK